MVAVVVGVSVEITVGVDDCVIVAVEVAEAVKV
jgi:hypothetical protein